MTKINTISDLNSALTKGEILAYKKKSLYCFAKKKDVSKECKTDAKIYKKIEDFIRKSSDDSQPLKATLANRAKKAHCCTKGIKGLFLRIFLPKLWLRKKEEEKSFKALQEFLSTPKEQEVDAGSLSSSKTSVGGKQEQEVDAGSLSSSKTRIGGKPLKFLTPTPAEVNSRNLSSSSKTKADEKPFTPPVPVRPVSVAPSTSNAPIAPPPPPPSVISSPQSITFPLRCDPENFYHDDSGEITKEILKLQNDIKSLNDSKAKKPTIEQKAVNREISSLEQKIAKLKTQTAILFSSNQSEFIKQINKLTNRELEFLIGQFFNWEIPTKPPYSGLYLTNKDMFDGILANKETFAGDEKLRGISKNKKRWNAYLKLAILDFIAVYQQRANTPIIPSTSNASSLAPNASKAPQAKNPPSSDFAQNIKDAMEKRRAFLRPESVNLGSTPSSADWDAEQEDLP